MQYRDPIPLRAIETWKLRVLLASGLAILFVNSFSDALLGMQIPRGLDFYLTIASCYFAMNPQKRVEKTRDQVFTSMFFPGAFVTALLPFFSLILFALHQEW